MEITVTIERILDVVVFRKRDGSEAHRCSFIGRTLGDFPTTIKFDVLDEEKFRKMDLRVGSTYSLGVNISSRAWNGGGDKGEQWFTSVLVWRSTLVEADGSPTYLRKGGSSSSSAVTDDVIVEDNAPF